MILQDARQCLRLAGWFSLACAGRGLGNNDGETSTGRAHTYPFRFLSIVAYATENNNGPCCEPVDEEEREVGGASAATPLEPPCPASHS